MPRTPEVCPCLFYVLCDETGTVIPGVDVTILSIAHDFTWSMTTNDEGIFVVPLLPPGNCERRRINSEETRNVIVDVNDQSAVKICFDVGKYRQPSRRRAGQAQSERSISHRLTNIDPTFVINLPLSGLRVQPVHKPLSGTHSQDNKAMLAMNENTKPKIDEAVSLAESQALSAMSQEIKKLKVSLRRADAAFRILAKAAFTLAGLALSAVATLFLLGKLSLLPALIIVNAALNFGLAGFVLYIEALTVSTSDLRNDPPHD